MKGLCLGASRSVAGGTCSLDHGNVECRHQALVLSVHSSSTYLCAGNIRQSTNLNKNKIPTPPLSLSPHFSNKKKSQVRDLYMFLKKNPTKNPQKTHNKKIPNNINNKTQNPQTNKPKNKPTKKKSPQT